MKVDDDLNNAEKIFLLLLSENNKEPIQGNLWIQKEVFLLSKNLKPLEDYLDYEAHLQGPFSESVKNIVDNLQYLGLVKKINGKIKLTKKGDDIASKFKEGASKEIIDLIQDIKSFMNELSKEELLLYVYFTYPEMTEESVEFEDIKSKREKIALDLYHKGKVSLEKAAELSGLSLSEFRGRLD